MSSNQERVRSSAERLSRRDVLKVAAGVAGAKVFASVAAAEAQTPAPAGTVKNAIIIVSDTMRRDALGCFGGAWIRTPKLDAFARRAVRMDQAFISSFPTVPCRNDILVGRHTFAYKPWEPIDDDAVAIQDILEKDGIRTALFVDTPHPFTPTFHYQRGFDVAHVNRGQEGDPWKDTPKDVKLPCDVKKLRSGKRVVTQYLRNVSGRDREEDYFVAETMRNAADWLTHGRKPGERFFLYVDTFDPHEPWDPPKPYADAYDPNYSGDEVIYPRYDYWREFLSEKELRHCRALYAGEASLVDNWIGHLLATIERLDLLKDTLVVVLTDHGFLFGEHGIIGKALIRDNKFQNCPLYPQISHIPMLVSFPGCQGGQRRRELVQTIDLMPTVLEFLGVSRPASVEGESMHGLLTGRGQWKRKLAVSSPTLYCKTMKTPNPTVVSSITDGRWMLLYGAQNAAVGGGQTSEVDSQRREQARLSQTPIAPQLFDIVADEACEKDRLRQDFGAARELHRQYAALLERLKIPEEYLRHFQTLAV
jgi:arylsulfatase A-like enzyme